MRCLALLMIAAISCCDRNGVVDSTTTIEDCCNHLTNWWVPDHIVIFLHDMADSLVHVDTLDYDEMLAGANAEKALVKLRSDTLIEFIRYPACYTENRIVVSIDGNRIEYGDAPELLGSSSSGTPETDSVFFIDSMCIFKNVTMLDTLRQRQYAKGITLSFLKNTSDTLSKDTWGENQCEELRLHKKRGMHPQQEKMRPQCIYGELSRAKTHYPVLCKKSLPIR